MPVNDATAEEAGEGLELSPLTYTRKMLRDFGLRARKGLGQHFLVSGRALKLILSSAGITSDDVVVEVGPGLGVLTRELVRRAGHVLAIELDDRLAAILKGQFAPFSNVTIVNRDVLEVDIAALLEEHGAKLPPAHQGYKVVANLPYYITSPVLRHFLESPAKPGMMLVMVQKEVAQAIVAGPGQRSILSISVQFYGKPRIVGYVPAGSFLPPPEVDSAVLKIEVYPRPAVEVDEKAFFRLVRAGFCMPRKQLANPLSHGLDLPKSSALALLEKAGIAPQRRAETLSVAEWAQLLQALDAMKEGRDADH